MDNGDVLTEGAVIVQMIADKVPGKNLVPAAGTTERYRAQEWLNFVSTELHKNFSPLFNPAIPDDVKLFFKDRITGKFTYINSALAGKDYLMGSQFTVADGYLFTILRWADGQKIEISGLENLVAYKARVAARPMVQEALKAEGLMKAS
jgi:glutathione S-transferase